MADGIVLDKVELKLGAKDFRFDCALPTGTVTAVTGPSGSGKTTFLNLIAGFETPDRGTIRVAGGEVTRKHPSERPAARLAADGRGFAPCGREPDRAKSLTRPPDERL